MVAQTGTIAFLLFFVIAMLLLLAVSPAAAQPMVVVDLEKEVSYVGVDYGPGENVAVPEHVAHTLGLVAKPVISTEMRELTGTDVPRVLSEAGFGTVELIRAATDEQLLAIDGIGPVTLAKIRSTIGGGGT